MAGREPELPAPTRVGSEIITQASDSTGCGGTGSLLVNRNLKVPKDRQAMGDRKWGRPPAGRPGPPGRALGALTELNSLQRVGH